MPGGYNSPRIRTCKTCQCSFSALWGRQLFCTFKCRRKAKRLRFWRPGVSRNQQWSHGAAGELLVCADILELGLYAFKNVSHHGPADIVAVSKTGQMWRIEVKQARQNMKNECFQLSVRHGVPWIDVVAVVAGQEVLYFKPRPSTFYRRVNAIRPFSVEKRTSS